MSKSVVFIYADSIDFNAADSAMQKFMKKAVLLTHYKGGDLAELTQIGGYEEVELSSITEEFINSHPVTALRVHTPSEALAAVFEASDRSTLIVLLSGENAALYGLAINSKLGSLDREAFARDIATTVCYIADVPLPPNPTGAILYQALKEPNLKASELKKAQETIESMEMAMDRKTRNPWDKHDCA